MIAKLQKKDNPLILIADDDYDTRLLLRSLLQDRGYQVLEAENGEECIAVYRQYHPDLILLDAIMPGMDSFTCCQFLKSTCQETNSSQEQNLLDWSKRRSVKTASVSILMLVELEDIDSIERVFEAGAIDYITKPIQTAVVSNRLFRILEAKWTQDALRTSEEKYRFVVENLKEVIFQANNLGELSFLNPAWCQITGFSIEESLGKKLEQFIHPLDRQNHQEKWQLLQQNPGKDCRYQARYFHKNGNFGWIEICAYATLKNSRSQLSIFGTINEITESKRIEQYQQIERKVILILAESADFTVAITKIIQAICRTIGWEVGEFWEVVPPGDRLRCVESWLNSDLAVNPQEISKQVNYLTGVGLPGRLWIVGRVWTSGKPIWFGSQLENQKLPKASIARKFGLQPAFGFPIASEIEKIGVTIFYSREQCQCDRELIQLMTTVGAQIGQFIQRKQAEAELHQQHLILRTELDRAAEYVRSLLPSPLSGSITIEQQYLPSLQLGGDIFDYYWLDRQHLVIYLLDVAGHGVHSALLSVSILNFLRSQYLSTQDFYQPEKILSELNRIFKIDENGDKFFTIWYGVYNLCDRQLTYSCAGHAPAILLANEHQDLTIEKLSTKDLPIGMFSEAKYQQNSCYVKPDSFLYVFSDGVYEIFQANGQIWGLDAFTNHIYDCHKHKNSSLQTIFDRIQTINGKSRFDDDFSLLRIYFN
jgi:sigma-B regulation protein RsbU (phosphoserine phosphatase)